MAGVPVSVVIPNYNSGSSLMRSVESVMRGVGPGEILIIDDGSTDGSDKIAEQAQERYANVHLIRHGRNEGIAGARRTGFLRAHFDWVAYVDADDYIEDGAIEQAYRTAVKQGLDVCLWRLWRANEERTSEHLKLDSNDFPLSGRQAALLTIGSWRIHPLGVSRRALYLEAYEKELPRASNADEAVSRLALYGAREIGLCERRYFYCQNPRSSSVSLHRRRLSELRTHLWVIRFSEEINAPEASRRRAVLSSIGHAWFLWRKRRFLGLSETRSTLREYFTGILSGRRVSWWFARYPKHVGAFLFLWLYAGAVGGSAVRQTDKADSGREWHL